MTHDNKENTMDEAMETPTVCPHCHETFDAAVHFVLRPYAEVCPNCNAVMRPTDRERV